MKGDIVIRKKYVDAAKDFFIGDFQGVQFIVLNFLFFFALVLIEMCLVIIFSVVDSRLCNGMIPHFITTWIFYGQFVIYHGSVIMDGLALLGYLTWVFAGYMIISAVCDVIIAVGDFF
jgi:hypothetical protein